MKAQLEQEAGAQHRSLEETAIRILRDALGRTSASPTAEDVVARIKATSPNPHGLRPARASLAAVLRAAPDDSNFDLARWNQEWAAVEDEMKAVTRANDAAEGRR